MAIMVLVGVPPEILQQWLLDAQTAYAALMSGQKEVSVAYEGKSVTYMQPNMGALMAWIMALQSQLASMGLLPPGTGSRRPLYPYYR
jgi:hypothetical protein